VRESINGEVVAFESVKNQEKIILFVSKKNVIVLFLAYSVGFGDFVDRMI
jgi:hypothetical protein